MLWFKREKRLYPSVYSEWVKEFKRMDTAFLSEEDAQMLRTGGLKDSKYCIENFKKELHHFLEKQILMFFQDLGKSVQMYTEENNSEYLLLTIRRYNAKYERIFFFEDFDFLTEQHRQKLKSEIKAKLVKCQQELADYFQRLSLYSPSMSELSLNIKRLIEV